MKHIVWIMPHSHYDAEVFIVEKETLEIGYANILGALNRLRRDPNFKFALDQTCLIEPFLNTYPEERDFFQQMIEAGRLEITGGMYIMPDVNIPSGESFIRQVMLGKRYCRQELNIDVRTGWTIDTFGHHPQIPQLMRKCGLDHTFLQRVMRKDGPSEFYYQGLDGSRLFCHWMPGSYGLFYFAPGNLPEFKKFVEQRVRHLEQHAVTGHLLALAGADLTPVEPQLLPMIEAYNASQAEIELRIATPAECVQAVKESGDFPTICEDLNPVFQGCYSARIDIKQWNRRLENQLVNCEKVDALAQRLGALPQEAAVWEAWRGVLFNQFHDIICGSHVDAVFENTMDRFKHAQKTAETCLHASLQAIADQIDTSGDGVPVVVFNPLGWERSDAVECPVAFSEPGIFELAAYDSLGRPVASDLFEAERYADGSLKRARLLFIARDVPAFGYEVYHLAAEHGQAAETDLRTSHPAGGMLRFELDHGWLENAFFRVEFDLWTGLVTRLYDKTNHWEVLPEEVGRGNMVVKERDFGNFWMYNGPCKGDAFYPMEGRYPLPEPNSTLVDYAHTYLGDGNIRQGRALAEFTIGHPYGSGQFATRARLYAGIPRIDFQTTIINNDERVRYRAAFPTSIRGGTITYEIPFGAIARPEGEFPAQNWIDYSDGERGVMLLNQGLPGNNVVDGVMLLSLLKCTALKEGYAEVGGFKLSTPTERGYEKGIQHTFDYALAPHKGDWRDAQAYRRGAEFNQLLITIKPSKKAGPLPARKSFLSIRGKNIVLSAVKPAAGGIIVRLYEAEGRPAESVILQSGWPVAKAFETNLLEENEVAIPIQEASGGVALSFTPFEIKTIKLVMLTDR